MSSIEEIAAQLTDNINSNNGLIEDRNTLPDCFNNSHRRKPKYKPYEQEESLPSIPYPPPLLNNKGEIAKSVTLLETKGYKVINKVAKPAATTPAPTPITPSTPIPAPKPAQTPIDGKIMFGIGSRSFEI